MQRNICFWNMLSTNTGKIHETLRKQIVIFQFTTQYIHRNKTNCPFVVIKTFFFLHKMSTTWKKERYSSHKRTVIFDCVLCFRLLLFLTKQQCIDLFSLKYVRFAVPRHLTVTAVVIDVSNSLFGSRFV